MRIINIMTSRKRGGIEQAFADYTAALLSHNHQVMTVTDYFCKVKEPSPENPRFSGMKIFFSRYNYPVIPYLYRKFKKFAPDVIITHSRRSVPLLRIVANMLNVPLAGVAHNPKIKLINRCDFIFSITDIQKKIFADKGFPAERIFVVPNMMAEIPPYRSFKPHTPPVIAAMGRFDPMKGFPDYICALNELKKNGVRFRAVLGGNADAAYKNEDKIIRGLIKEFKLEEDIELVGWVNDKRSFYEQADVFVLPSLFEPFGIVLLEAMAHCLPVVSSLAEGPSEIFAGHENCALTFPLGDYKALAACLQNVLADSGAAREMARNGYNLVHERYSLTAVAATLENALAAVLTLWREKK